MLPLPVKPIFVLGKSFLSTFVSKFVRDKMGRMEVIMLDEVKVRARKSAKHGKTYEYRFETAPIGGERKWYSKGGFLSEKEARKAGLEELKRYYSCGLPERSSNIS